MGNATDAGWQGGIPEGIRILVADGNMASLRDLSEMLTREGMETAEADGVEPALAAFRDAADSRRPFALVILETTISDGRGLELARILREGACGPAILVLTWKAEVKEAEQYHAAGVRSYLQQPVTQSELMNAISAALASDSLEKLSLFSSGGHTAVQPSDGVESLSIIEELAPEIAFDGELFEDDPQFLAEIVSLFLKTYPQQLSAIEDAILRKDAAGLCKAAHSLKGAVANFGAKAVVEQAAALETMGKDGSFSGAAEGAVALRALLCEFEPELQAALKKAMEQVSM